MLISSCIVFALMKCFQAHVSLLFPPARYPPLDFLDNARTKEPCGVPRPVQAQYTNLALGQTYDIVWHLGYAHKGGFQIDLLDSTGKVIKVFTPNGFVGNETTNETTQMYTLTIPKDLQPCNQCVLRLQRNAQEWDTYKFWSCSDVNIIPTSASITPCFGAVNGQTCQCPHLRSGQYCQFQDECAEDSDCGTNQGKCIDLKTSGRPKKVCYCTAPNFGKHCEKKFEPNKDDLKQNCFNYKFNQPNLVISPGTAGVDNLMAQYSNKGLFNPQCYHKETVEDGHLFYWRFVGDEVEMIMDYPGQSWMGVGWRPDYLNGRCQDFPIKTNDVHVQPEIEPPHHVHKRDSHQAHPLTNVTSNVTLPLPEPEPKPVAEVHKPHAEPTPEPEAPAAMHPMDCTDIVIGSAQGKLTRAADMYTRDRSTPMDDSVYKGKDDLTAVFGAEVDGRTVIMFRKPIKASDQSDHELIGDMRMIWARGQNPAEKQSVGHAEFYEPDVLKYHGGNRGSFSISFGTPSANSTSMLTNPLIHQTSISQSSNDSNHDHLNAAGHPTGTNAAQSGGNKKDNLNNDSNKISNTFTFFLFSTLISFFSIINLI